MGKSTEGCGSIHMGLVLGLHMFLYKKGRKGSDKVPRERVEQNSPISCLFHNLL